MVQKGVVWHIYRKRRLSGLEAKVKVETLDWDSGLLARLVSKPHVPQSVALIRDLPLTVDVKMKWIHLRLYVRWGAFRVMWPRPRKTQASTNCQDSTQAWEVTRPVTQPFLILLIAWDHRIRAKAWRERAGVKIMSHTCSPNQRG